MKKLLFILIAIGFGTLNISFGLTTSCFDGSKMYRESLERCQSGGYCYSNIDSLKKSISEQQKKYNECLREKANSDKYNNLNTQGENKIKNGDFYGGITLLEQARDLGIKTNIIDKRTVSGLNDKIGKYYVNQGNDYYNKNDKKNAMYCYEKGIGLVGSLGYSEINKGEIYHRLGKLQIEFGYYEKAYQSLQQAKKNTLFGGGEDLNKDIIYAFNWMNAITKDEFSYYQYYLTGLNILNAQDKLPDEKNEVIIAVIDDGVNVNHPDLQGHIWINEGEIPGNGIDDDRNGFIDDYNGWDFVRNTNNIQPSGYHGTAVSNIIAANKDNEIGIAGIVPNVKIMSLNVFNSNGVCKSDNVMKAISYARLNGANIINMSLGGSQFEFSTYYNRFLKEIYDAGIPIIISAGNGDANTNKNVGINTSINKISYACNEDDKKTLITVGASNRDGNRTSWTNYGSCVDFYAPGEAIPYYRANSDLDLVIGNGTSFSAPMVAGIVGLGYNKFGKLKPNIIYDALTESVVGNTIDASKYLDVLSAEFGELKEAIQWMYKKGFTKRKTANEFNYSRGIRRDEAAKFFVEYAKTVLKKEPKYKQGCVFSDLEDASKDLRHSVVEACRLGIFNGSNGKIKPAENLTNAQAITVFMRLIRGKKDESGEHYADRYFNTAWNLGLLDATLMNYKKNYGSYATRGDVAIMLYRGSKLKNK